METIYYRGVEIAVTAVQMRILPNEQRVTIEGVVLHGTFQFEPETRVGINVGGEGVQSETPDGWALDPGWKAGGP